MADQNDDPTASRPQILFVCTANICRSPAAETIARDRFGEARFRFRSAGFLEHGRPFEPDMAKAVAKLGVAVPGDHRSAVIDADLLASSALILTMEARHVQNIVIEDERAFERVLPLKEAVELIERAASTGSTACSLPWSIAIPCAISIANGTSTIPTSEDGVTTNVPPPRSRN
ncbi:MAG: hypothetical protein R2710_19315 [Acidimicrobiales bacterium]